jgi:hypothetical protein
LLLLLVLLLLLLLQVDLFGVDGRLKDIWMFRCAS